MSQRLAFDQGKNITEGHGVRRCRENLRLGELCDLSILAASMRYLSVVVSDELSV